MREPPTSGPLARGAAYAIVALRWPIVLGWIAAAVAAVALLPTLGGAGASPLEDIVPAHSASADAADRAARLFGAPVATDTALVTRNPRGLSGAELRSQADAARFAARARGDGLRAAVPIVNEPVGGVRWPERRTTVVAFLFPEDALNLAERRDAAEVYAKGLRPGPGTRIGVTGAGPARLAQFAEIEDARPWVEAATVLAIR